MRTWWLMIIFSALLITYSNAAEWGVWWPRLIIAFFIGYIASLIAWEIDKK